MGERIVDFAALTRHNDKADWPHALPITEKGRNARRRLSDNPRAQLCLAWHYCAREYCGYFNRVQYGCAISFEGGN